MFTSLLFSLSLVAINDPNLYIGCFFFWFPMGFKDGTELRVQGTRFMLRGTPFPTAKILNCVKHFCHQDALSPARHLIPVLKYIPRSTSSL